MNIRRSFLLLTLVAGLAACRSVPAPVEESPVLPREAAEQTQEAAKPKTAQTHTVEKGDTLYSIAFRYGLDFRTLAALNGVTDPYTIYPGQVLTVKSRGKPIVPRPKPAPKTDAPKTDVAKLDAPKPDAPDATVTKPVPAAAPFVTVGVADSTKPADAPATKPADANAAKPALQTQTLASAPAELVGKPAVRAAAGGLWQWPVQGTVLGGFNRSGGGPRGVSIAGKPGDPVRAARDGRVVYIGDSLVGYGQLVILKHDDVYLSAYAHNSRLLVREGDAVKAGDTIAEMGSTGTDRTKLHFEVRRNGEPIDPLSVLPRQ